MATPINLPSIYKSIQAPTGSNPQDVQLAKDQLAMEYAPQESSITNTINTLNQYLERDINTQQQYGQVADQKIATIGNELAQKLQGNVGAIGDIYQQGGQQVAGAYDQASQDVGNIGQSLRDRLAQGANALGQQQTLAPTASGTDPVSRLMALQASSQTQLATSKAGATSTLASLGTKLKGIAQKVVGDSEQEYAQKRADLATQVMKVIGQLQTTTNQNVMEQLQKFSALAEVEGPAFRTLLAKATSARTEAERQTAKDAFDQAMQLADLDIKRQKANTEAAKAAKEDDPNSLDNIYKKLQIEKLGIDVDNLSNSKSYLSDLEGNQNLMAWLNANVRKDRKSPGLSGTEHAGIQNFINQYLPQASMSGMYNTTDPVKILAGIAQQNIDPKTGKVKLPTSPGTKYSQQDYETDFQTLLEALTARFTNVGTSAKTGTRIK